MSLALTLLWVVGQAPAGTPPAAAAPEAPTQCLKCHTPDGWDKVTFPHDRTGFPLLGQHARVSCGDCHVAGVDQKLDARCFACHTDVHAGTLGRLCESCHDERSFRGAMPAPAHGRTAFPLLGAHAVIPCKECHQGVRELSFSRAAVTCERCHLADYSRAAQISIDHAAAGFGTDCRRCHTPTDFRGARFPEHERCFAISGGPHGRLSCGQCHSSLMGSRLDGTCRTNTAACTSCHEHRCAASDPEHRDVPGYQCKDRKCYECHTFTQ